MYVKSFSFNKLAYSAEEHLLENSQPVVIAFNISMIFFHS